MFRLGGKRSWKVKYTIRTESIRFWLKINNPKWKYTIILKNIRSLISMYTRLGDADFSDRKTETIRPSGRKLYDQIRIHTNLKRSYPSPYFKLSIILIRNWPSPLFEIDPIYYYQVTPIFIRNWPCCEMIVNRQKIHLHQKSDLNIDKILWSYAFSRKIVDFSQMIK